MAISLKSACEALLLLSSNAYGHRPHFQQWGIASGTPALAGGAKESKSALAMTWHFNLYAFDK
jgi:hypothetical protein